MDQQLKKWIKWLAEIRPEIERLVINRDVFWEVQKIIKTNVKLHKPSSFYSFLGRTYVAYASMGIRRQLKIDRKSISLSRLLTEMARRSDLLSRAYYTGLYRNIYSNPVILAQADRHFDALAGNGNAHISTDSIQKDIELLANAGKKVEEYADRRIAHFDKRKPTSIPRFSELDKAIDILDALYVKYHLICHAEKFATLMPVYQYDWKQIFYVPWLKEIRR